MICTSFQTDNHASTLTLSYSLFTGRMAFRPPNQQHQSTEGNHRSLEKKTSAKACPVRDWRSTPLEWLSSSRDLDLDLVSGRTAYRRASVIDLCLHTDVSVLTLIPPQRAPLPAPSFTPNLITVILSTTTYLSLRSPACNRSRTLLHMLLLKLLNPVTSLLSYAVFTGSKRIKYKLLSLTYKVLTL